MRRQTLSTFLMMCGALLMLVGVSLIPAQRVVLANASQAPQAAPSPRPPIASTPERPRRDRGGGGSDNSPTAVPAGRITGTVIDQTTGAPAVGVTVNVGGKMVVTDKNGNYESAGISAGNYAVLLMLPNTKGLPSQGIQTVRLEDGATVVVHLGFRSILQSAAASPTTVPPTAVVPTAVVPTAALPIDRLPSGGVAPGSETVAAAQPDAASAPTRLPRTSGYAGEAWAWLIAGAALVVAGAGLRPVASRWIAAARELPLLAALVKPTVAAQPLTLREIARARNLLVVGRPASSSLLRQLIRLRAGAHVALVPYGTDQQWPCRVVGNGDSPNEVERYLRAAVVALKQRQQALADGAASAALQPITVVIERPAALLAAGDSATPLALRTLLAEGRKVGRYLLLAAASDSPRELGLSGRGSVLAAFDYVIYLGDEAIQRLPSAAALPVPAVAYRARGNMIALLELPALTPDDELLAGLLA